MASVIRRKQRIDRFVDLARVYRGWNKSETFEALGRESGKVTPESGNPKLDLLVRLADALDWGIGDVAESVWQAEESVGEVGTRSFAELDKEARALHRAGEYRQLVTHAAMMRQCARSSTERAIAANRMAGGYDGLGWYVRMLECVQEGLAEPSLPRDLRLMLLVNLANVRYSLWNLHEARAIASDILDRFAHFAPMGRLERVARAFAWSVRGNAQRRLLWNADEPFEHTVDAASTDLRKAQHEYEALALEFDDSHYKALANTCRGAILELDVASGQVEEDVAIAEIVSALDQVVDVDNFPRGELLESWGWWSIFGCNIALRSAQSMKFQQELAICTNKAAEIAERLDNWAMRERAFTMEHFRSERPTPEGISSQPWTLDAEDIRVLAGAMGRFPHFRPTGWAILERAGALSECSSD
ncbi:MAG: hypothetical protein EXS10_06100 [Phycisphaerales bacterium]|nr:hypothetical protein [Phycisphaerales bacterium]